MGDFYIDNQYAKRNEKECANHIKTLGTTDIKITVGKFPDYDIIAKMPFGEERTFECKLDRQAKNTGNVCFEVYKKELNGDKSKGGLSASKANYYLQTIRGMKEIYLLEKDTVWKLVEGKKLCDGDKIGDGNCYVVYVPMEEFLEAAGEPMFIRDDEEIRLDEEEIERERQEMLEIQKKSIDKIMKEYNINRK